MANPPNKGNPNTKPGKTQQQPQKGGKQYVQGQSQTGRTNPNTGTTGSSWE